MSSTKQSRRPNEPAAAAASGGGGRRSRASLASSSGTSVASSAATSSTACSSRSGRDRSQLRVRIDASAKDNEGKGKPKKRCAMCKAAQNAYLKACAIPGVSLLPPPPACPHPPPPAKPKRKRAPKEHVVKKLESLRSVDNCYAADETAAASKTSRSAGGSGGSGKIGDTAVERNASRGGAGGGGGRDTELAAGSGNRSGTARCGPSAAALAARDQGAPAPSAAATGSLMPPPPLSPQYDPLPALPIFVRYNPLRGLFGGCAELADDEIDAVVTAAAQDPFKLAAAASNGNRLDTLAAGRDAAGAAAALAASAAGFRSPNLDKVDEGVTQPLAARPDLAEIGRERVKSQSVVSVAEHRKSRAGLKNVGREMASTSGGPSSAARSPKTAKAASAKAEQSERSNAAELAASRGGAVRLVPDDDAAYAPTTSAAVSAEAGKTRAARQQARTEAADSAHGANAARLSAADSPGAPPGVAGRGRSVETSPVRPEKSTTPGHYSPSPVQMDSRAASRPVSDKDGDARRQQPSPPLSPAPPPQQQQQQGAPVKRDRPTPARRAEVAAAAERTLQPTAPTASGFAGYSDERTLGAPANYGDYRSRLGVHSASATPLAHGNERTAPAAVAAVSLDVKTAGQTMAASSLATAGAPPESRKAAALYSDAAAVQPTKTAQAGPAAAVPAVRHSAPIDVASAAFAAGSPAARQQQSPPSPPFVDGGPHSAPGAARDCTRQAAHGSSSRRRTETSAERRRRHQQQQQEADDDDEDDDDDDESEYSEYSDTSSRDS